MCWQSDWAGWKPHHWGSQVSANQDYLTYLKSMDFQEAARIQADADRSQFGWRSCQHPRPHGFEPICHLHAFLRLFSSFWRVRRKSCCCQTQKWRSTRLHRRLSSILRTNTKWPGDDGEHFQPTRVLTKHWPEWRSPSTSTSTTPILSQGSLLLRK